MMEDESKVLLKAGSMLEINFRVDKLIHYFRICVVLFSFNKEKYIYIVNSRLKKRLEIVWNKRMNSLSGHSMSVEQIHWIIETPIPSKIGKVATKWNDVLRVSRDSRLFCNTVWKLRYGCSIHNYLISMKVI